MITDLIASGNLLLAEFGPSNAPPDNPEWGKAAPTGLFVLLALAVACYFLFRSMNRQMRKVPEDFTTGATQEDTRDLLGEADSGLPVRENSDVSAQTPPRLGTPDALLANRRRARVDKALEAKAKARAKQHKD